MEQRKSSKLRKFLFLCAFLIIISSTGCAGKKTVEEHRESKLNNTVIKDAIPHSFTNGDIIAPLTIKKGQFNAIRGWLNNETIIYQTNVEQGSSVYTYNLFTGETKLLFESEAPIATVLANPAGSKILIHAAPSTYEGEITIIDLEGQELMKKKLEAFDFEFKWNPYDEDTLLISLFTENWDFTTLQLNVVLKEMSEVSLKEPFAHWVDENDVLYLNWSDASLFAPLMKKSLVNASETMMLNEIYFVETIKNLVMTITVNQEQKEQAVYSFLTSDFHPLSSFSIPHLARFSDWFIPFSSFDSDNHFFTFKPLYSTDVDEYREGFQLISFDILEKKEMVLLEDMKNEPLSCSPNGKYCLYGFYLEKLIDVEMKQLIPLVDQRL